MEIVAFFIIVIVVAIVVMAITMGGESENVPTADLKESAVEPEKQTYSHGVVPHILLFGPPGIGKTTLARVIRNEVREVYGRDVYLHSYTPYTLNKAELHALAGRINYGDIVFIDEIHGLDIVVEEAMYSIVQDFIYSTDMGEEIRVNRFTLIGATTRSGKISKPLRDRFNIAIELDPMTDNDLLKVAESNISGIKVPEYFDSYIGQENAKALLKMHIHSIDMVPVNEVDGFIKESISKRACGNPRVLKQILANIQALQRLLSRGLWVSEFDMLMDLIGIDEIGLHRQDYRVINALKERENKPIGLQALASLAGVSKDDLENVIEPRLDYLGVLLRTPRGRMLSDKYFPKGA